MSKSLEEKVSLQAIIRNKLNQNLINSQNIQTFWGERDFVLGVKGEVLCKLIKGNVSADDVQEKFWEDKIQGIAKDLESLKAFVVSKIGITPFNNDLKRGYLIAIIEIAKNELLSGVSPQITALEHALNVKKEESPKQKSVSNTRKLKRRSSLQKITKVVQRDKNKKLRQNQNKKLEEELQLLKNQKEQIELYINQVRLDFMGQFQNDEAAKAAKNENKERSDEMPKISKKESEEKSNELELEAGDLGVVTFSELLNKKNSPTDSTGASDNLPEPKGILDTLAQGRGETISALKKVYFEHLSQEEFNAVFNRFKLPEVQAFEDNYLFLSDNKEIREATWDLLSCLIRIQSDELKWDGKESSAHPQKSGEQKIEGLVTLIKEITTAKTLTQIKTALTNALTQNGEGTLRENRGPVGGFWIGSMFQGQRNPIDKKWINSTTELKLAEAYKKVLDKEAELEKAQDDVSEIKFSSS